jgi:hypothetical protein
MHCDEFTNARPASDFCLSLFSGELQILRRQPDGNKRKEVRLVAYARTAVYNAMAIDSHSVSQNYFFADYRVRSNRTITANLST